MVIPPNTRNSTTFAIRGCLALELLEGILENEQLQSVKIAPVEMIPQGNAPPFPSPLGARLRPRVIDEDPPHDASCDAEEVTAPLPVDAFAVDQPKVRFVDESRGLQSVIAPFGHHQPPCQFVQDEGRCAVQVFGKLLAACGIIAHRQEDARDSVSR